MMQILQTIKDSLLAHRGRAVYKSDLKGIGIDPRTAEHYFRIIHLCQSEIPRLSITEQEGRFLVTIELED